jgi:hypothetical protein
MVGSAPTLLLRLSMKLYLLLVLMPGSTDKQVETTGCNRDVTAEPCSGRVGAIGP